SSSLVCFLLIVTSCGPRRAVLCGSPKHKSKHTFPVFFQKLSTCDARTSSSITARASLHFQLHSCVLLVENSQPYAKLRRTDLKRPFSLLKGNSREPPGV